MMEQRAFRSVHELEALPNEGPALHGNQQIPIGLQLLTIVSATAAAWGLPVR